MATSAESLDKIVALHKEFETVRSRAISTELIIQEDGVGDYYPAGPAGNVILCLEGIFTESLQGSNQACSEPEDDTLWTEGELEAFASALEHGMKLCKFLVGLE